MTNLTRDRIDVNGNYEPSNCRWVGYSAQLSNRRSSHKDGFKYVGIYNDKRHGIFDVNIKYKGKCLFRKYFKSLKDAVIERNEFIIKNKLPHRLNDTKGI